MAEPVRSRANRERCHCCHATTNPGRSLQRLPRSGRRPHRAGRSATGARPLRTWTRRRALTFGPAFWADADRVACDPCSRRRGRLSFRPRLRLAETLSVGGPAGGEGAGSTLSKEDLLGTPCFALVVNSSYDAVRRTRLRTRWRRKLWRIHRGPRLRDVDHHPPRLARPDHPRPRARAWRGLSRTGFDGDRVCWVTRSLERA